MLISEQKTAIGFLKSDQLWPNQNEVTQPLLIKPILMGIMTVAKLVLASQYVKQFDRFTPSLAEPQTTTSCIVSNSARVPESIKILHITVHGSTKGVIFFEKVGKSFNKIMLLFTRTKALIAYYSCYKITTI